MSTGVLPFVRGIDLSRNDFQEENFPKSFSEMTGLRWLKLNRTNMEWIPEEFTSQTKLETLSLVRNNLVTLHGEVSLMRCLRYLNCRHNILKNCGIPSDIFNFDELLVLDLSHNQLKEVPSELEYSRGLLVLNLGHNHIESIPNQLFVNLSDLLYLDLSNNKLDTLPPQMRRLVNLQTLILNNNPLGQNQMRHLPAMVSLQSLHLRNTQRNMQNMPSSLDSLTHLIDIDISYNNLVRIPDAFFSISNLKRINLSDNCLNELPHDIGDVWQNLEVLNLCRNKLKALPASLCKMSKLRRLYVNDNQLEFEGIPSGIGKLYNLEVFMAANNYLEMIPEGVVRCGRLKKIVLANNRLITLPDAIHLLNDLDVLDLSNNPDLVMPPKPTEYYSRNNGSGTQFYNIDFSLNAQLKLAGDPNSDCATQSQLTPSKDPIARKMRLRRRARDNASESDSTNQAKVLKGMSDLAKDKNSINANLHQLNEADLKPKRWDEALEKPPLNYSDFFDEDVGQSPGLVVWEIENFLPNRIEEAIHGKFYEGDCYIILNTILHDKQNLNWEIYYWIGAEASLDKKACSAIHAVNLRNYLGAQCRTIREEQTEESDAFLGLFPSGIIYIEGGRTASGFFTVEEAEFFHRMFRLHEIPNRQRQLHLEPVPLSVESFDPRFVFFIDAGYKLYVWHGKSSKITMRQKARLLAEKINKEERKNKAEIMFCSQCKETDEFWSVLKYNDLDHLPNIVEHVNIDKFKPFEPLLYNVGLGMGYLELPQIDYKPKKLTKKFLETKNVYILDCSSDVFVWIGRKSSRLIRAAALKLAQELFRMVKRCDYAIVTRCVEGTEPLSFKTQFCGWDDIVAVDFTRTAESVSRTGADLSKWVKNQNVKIDLASLFMRRQPSTTKEEANQLIEEWNDDLEAMEAFVMENKKFVKLPESEIGHFYSGDCFVFLCRYWVPGEGEDNDNADDVEDDFECVVYFWQGRDASNMGWLTFTFSLQKKFEALFGEKLEVIRMHQQQENLKFLSHFKRKFIIHNGKRQLGGDNEKMCTPNVEFYHLRSNSNPITLRCIQIKPDASYLNSEFCYILKEPFDKENESGKAYVWIGSKADDDEAKIAEDIALQMFDSDYYSISIIAESEETESFWETLNGKKDYEKDASYMCYSRLFRCSNDKGYFSVSEKCSDFCQDDLADDDIMILDNGTHVFIWIGSRCSEVEIKLAYKSAQVYVQNMRVKQPERSRTLMLTVKGKETRRFTKCFHAWDVHKSVHDPRINIDKQQLLAIT